MVAHSSATTGAVAVSAASAPAATRDRLRWEALAMLMVLAFLNYMDRHLLNPALPLIATEFGLDKQSLGLLVTGFNVVYALTAPLVGWVSDRVTRKRLLVVLVIAWSIVTAASGLAWGFTSLLIFRAMTGLGEGGYFPTAVSLIGDLFPPDQRGRAIALHGLCTTLGGSAGFAVGGVLAENVGWRASFMLAIVPGLILAAVFARRFREPPRGAMAARETITANASAPARPYLRIITSPAVLLIALAAGAAAFSMLGLTTFMVSYLRDERGLGVGAAGTLTGFAFAFTIVGQLSGGFLSDRLCARLPRVRPLLVAVACTMMAPLVVAIAHSPAIAVAVGCFALAQIARGFAEPNLYGTIIDAVPASERGTAQGFLLMLTFAFGSASTWVAGMLIDAYGYATTIDVLAAASALAALFAYALTAYFRRGR
jgi:predicted MFS family arabinose efflux permease